MSRTRKGAKGPGWEIWSSRHPKLNGGRPGRKNKKLTTRYERRTARLATAPARAEGGA